MRLQAGVAADAAFPVLTAGYSLSAKARNEKSGKQTRVLMNSGTPAMSSGVSRLSIDATDRAQ
jgi:hypothetical protein